MPGYPADTSVDGLSSPLHGVNATSDPVLAFDGLGNLYYAGIAFNVSTTGPFGNGPLGNTVAFVAKYVNDGAKYHGATLITGPLADKDWIAVDTTGGPNDGNVYLVFDAILPLGPYYGTVFTRSTDGGRTFEPPFYAPADMTGEFPGVTVDPSGNVYVSTVAFDPRTRIPLNYTQVTQITSGGRFIARNVRAVDPASYLAQGARVPGSQFRGFTIPQIASDMNGIYLVFDDVRLGNSNVYLTRSTDAGASWTTPLRLNDVLAGQHFFPTIAASGRAISIAWYDSRLNNGATMNSLDVYFTDSLDGGNSFTPNIRITNNSFNPNLVNRTDAPNWNEAFMGDYFGIATTSTTAHPVWADNINACDTKDVDFGCVDQDALTSTVSLADFAISAQPQSQPVQPGSARVVKVALTSLWLFQGSVSLFITSTPSGLQALPTSVAVRIFPGEMYNRNFTLTTNNTTSEAAYTVNITGMSGPRIHSAIVTLVVTPPPNSEGSSLLDKLGILLSYLKSFNGIITVIVFAGVIVAGLFYVVRRKGKSQKTLLPRPR